ncbi:MAG: hypothetical protein LBU70_11180 [Chitinispirillales bacterium]|jgi:hypothetical protein|nr:hypothetical protein [Chitinispirillales bacterium]
MDITMMIAIAVVAALILVALKMALSRKEVSETEEVRGPMIHMSGIYSIVRESPRKGLAALRPDETAIRRFLDGINEDINGAPIRYSEREALVKYWKAQVELNLQEIEKGDESGAAFYYYGYSWPCPVCNEFVAKGNFVTREEIYNYPHIIPPFHLGCPFMLNAHHGADIRLKGGTSESDMAPFFDGEKPPPIPDWINVVSLPAGAGK